MRNIYIYIYKRKFQLNILYGLGEITLLFISGSTKVLILEKQYFTG